MWRPAGGDRRDVPAHARLRRARPAPHRGPRAREALPLLRGARLPREALAGVAQGPLLVRVQTPSYDNL